MPRYFYVFWFIVIDANKRREGLEKEGLRDRMATEEEQKRRATEREKHCSGRERLERERRSPLLFFFTPKLGSN